MTNLVFNFFLSSTHLHFLNQSSKLLQKQTIPMTIAKRNSHKLSIIIYITKIPTMISKATIYCEIHNGTFNKIWLVVSHILVFNFLGLYTFGTWLWSICHIVDDIFKLKNTPHAPVIQMCSLQLKNDYFLCFFCWAMSFKIMVHLHIMIKFTLKNL